MTDKDTVYLLVAIPRALHHRIRIAAAQRALTIKRLVIAELESALGGGAEHKTG